MSSYRQPWPYEVAYAVACALAALDWVVPDENHPAVADLAARLRRPVSAVLPRIRQQASAHPDYKGTPMRFTADDRRAVNAVLGQ